MKNPVYPAIAMGVGITVLLGYFLRWDILVSIRVVLLEWATILVAIAILVGIANLCYVHWRKVITASVPNIYSIVTLLALVITLGVVGWFGPTHAYSMWLFNHVQMPVESSLMALLAVILAVASVRLLRRRSNLLGILFVVTAVIVLLVSGPLFGIDLPGLSELRSWIARVPAVAGARGILLGVSLGIVATGLRVLMGSDRTYGG